MLTLNITQLAQLLLPILLGVCKYFVPLNLLSCSVMNVTLMLHVLFLYIISFVHSKSAVLMIRVVRCILSVVHWHMHVSAFKRRLDSSGNTLSLKHWSTKTLKINLTLYAHTYIHTYMHACIHRILEQSYTIICQAHSRY